MFHSESAPAVYNKKLEADSDQVPGSASVVLVTTAGEIEVELYWQHAPKTCRNFFELASHQYYNNCLFHRVSPNFVIQTGDPTGTGTGGESIYGKFFDDEIHPDLQHVGAGVVSMANTGQPNTNSSQFFITLAPTPFLNGSHTIFGRVKRGMDVVIKIGSVSTNRTERPLQEIKIIRTKIAQASLSDSRPLNSISNT